MKKIYIILVLLSILILPIVSSQQAAADDAGVNPDSFLWGLDKALDQIALLLAISPEAKAAKGLEIAQERLLEVKAMAEKHKLDAVAKAEDAHNKILLRVKQNIQSIEKDDAEVQIVKEIEIEKKLKVHEENVKRVKAELKVKIKIEGNLSAEQQSKLDEFLKSLENSINEVKLGVNDKKEKTKIKIKEKTGKSDIEIENEIEALELEKGVLKEKTKVEIRILRGKSFVKIEKEFDTKTTNKDALVDEIIEKFRLNASKVDSLLAIVDSLPGIETEDEEELKKDKLRIKAEIEDDIAEVEINLRFSLDSADRATIVNAILNRTQLSRSDVENNIEWDIKEKKDETSFEVSGNVKLSAEAQDTLDELVASFSNVTGKFELKLKVEKKHNLTDLEEEIKGNLSTEQRALWEELKNQSFALVKSSKGDEAELEIEIEHELKPKEKEGEELEIKVELEAGIAKIKIEVDDAKTKFMLNTTDQEVILQEIASRLGVSVESIRNLVEFEVEEVKEKKEIKVEIEDGKAKIKVEIDDEKLKFTLETTDKSAIIQEIAVRTGLSIEEVTKLAEFEEEIEVEGKGEKEEKKAKIEEKEDLD